MGDSSVATDKLGDSPAINLTGKIMVVVTILLFFLVVIILFYQFCSRSLWSADITRSQSRSRRRRRFSFATGHDGALRRGLDPSLLRSLPVLVFQSQDFKDGLECAVCLSELVDGEKARLLPECNHGFHVYCIDMWFQSHSTCPLCRNAVGSDSSNNEVEQITESSSRADNVESPTFPTNVLVWGDQTQISSTGGPSSEESASQPSSSVADNRRQGMLVIDIPNEITSTSLSPSASRFAEDELKSPMAARLRSLKRLLSRDRRLNPWSPSSVDVEQAGGGQS
ncbi:RING-H2 finger protein ATL60-like [Abrus precatorius]|uniref:RING-type E3 ubiquitin transferase n=1 Tax=Abrus precatorius TaxID=3816 RepID=A0A8B8L8I3_ABRPR|nr:RING-H2 finger protein ATL60-like [Abrus precatorius]